MDGEHKLTATEQKLAVLDILDLFGGLTDLKLLQFLTDHKIMNYFEMMFTLNDLCTQGQCERREIAGGYQYSLTPAGAEALDYFAKKMPSSLRDHILKAYQACREAYRQNQEYPTEHHQTGRGEYQVQMRIMEKNLEMLSVTLSVPDESIAIGIESRWPSIAQSVYRSFFSAEKEADI